MIGSCFTENMGEKLAKHLFHVLENPNGVLFNPVSVAEALHQYIDAPTFTKSDLFYLSVMSSATSFVVSSMTASLVGLLVNGRVDPPPELESSS